MCGGAILADLLAFKYAQGPISGVESITSAGSILVVFVL